MKKLVGLGRLFPCKVAIFSLGIVKYMLCLSKN